MSWLLDVNFVLATRWSSHPQHVGAKAWLDAQTQFYTCAITELGFVRISLSSVYGGTWNDIQESLGKLHQRVGFQFLADDITGSDAPETLSRDTTDAHLVALASRHGLKLATLDSALIKKAWAVNIAINPLFGPPVTGTT